MANPTNPIIHINESKVRLTAFFIFISVLLFIIFPNPIIPNILVIDFGLRAFDLGKYSPFAILGDKISSIFNLPVKPIFYPPKRFAARIGFIFSLIILGLFLTNINTIFITGTLLLFSGLESFAGICAGCFVYNWLYLFLGKLKK